MKQRTSAEEDDDDEDEDEDKLALSADVDNEPEDVETIVMAAVSGARCALASAAAELAEGSRHYFIAVFLGLFFKYWTLSIHSCATSFLCCCSDSVGSWQYYGKRSYCAKVW